MKLKCGFEIEIEEKSINSDLKLTSKCEINLLLFYIMILLKLKDIFTSGIEHKITINSTLFLYLLFLSERVVYEEPGFAFKFCLF
jgi:hypothetical protein